MNEMSILATLAGVHFIALLSPGPDVALVVQNATQHGRKTGVMIALGLSCGILVHLILSLSGISYLVKQQPMLFNLLQLAGGSYLLYLGAGALQSVMAQKNASTPTHSPAPSILGNRRQAFTKGMMTNLLNPKALVFLSACYLPDPSQHVCVWQGECRCDFGWLIPNLVLLFSLAAYHVCHATTHAAHYAIRR